ncbi:MAG TPA: hypothetical protein VM709_02450 [Candidatus Sulfotelmatobacter sp.]|nr:hypothetical protein [Candidatus Sulfotelmatobacter sp.]
MPTHQGTDRWNRWRLGAGAPRHSAVDLTLPLHLVAEGYRAMDKRGATKTLLRPQAVVEQGAENA